jgi:uncharacterized protein YjbI with pentapeptide repeats
LVEEDSSVTPDARPARAIEPFGRADLEAIREKWLPLLLRRRSLRWTVVGTALFVVVVILLYLSISVLPERIVEPPPELTQLEGNQRVQAENALEQTRNSVRTTLIQAIGGGLVFLTFAVGLGQLFTAREGQLVDRFTKTIDQLGEDKIDVRLGGVYALKQIAERFEYRRPIAEIFVAYLKTHATETPLATETSRTTAVLSPTAVRRPSVPGATRTGEEVRLRPDLQAVLRILVGEELWRRAGIERLDLSYIIVRNADLRGVDLSNVVLLGAVLDGSNLRTAKFRGADLRSASLNDADLRGADFEHADLSGAHLSRADLAEARLTNEALLVDATLNEANLRDAELELVDATRANLAGAKLINARLNQAVVTEANLSGANLSGATLFGVNLVEASDLSGIVLSGAQTDDTMRKQIEARLNASS